RDGGQKKKRMENTLCAAEMREKKTWNERNLERLDRADGNRRNQRADQCGYSSNRAGRVGLALIASAALDILAGTFRPTVEWHQVVAPTLSLAIAAAATPVRPAARN